MLTNPVFLHMSQPGGQESTWELVIMTAHPDAVSCAYACSREHEHPLRR